MMKYLKKYENADSILINNNKTHWRDYDAYPFAWEWNSVIIGKNRLSHDDSNIDFDLPFAGRIWTDRKVIAFWYYPDKDIFIKMINDLEKQLDISIWNNGYLIEIIVGDDGEIIKDEELIYEYDGAIHRELIPLEEYESSGDSPEEERIVHLMNAKEKEQYYKKHGKPRGWGSDLKARKNPLAWEQAKRTSESMKYLKKFETCDEIYINRKYGGTVFPILIEYNEKNIYPFIIIGDEVYIGEVGVGDTHAMIYHRNGMKDLEAVEGRIYEDQKVIGFWNLDGYLWLTDFGSNLKEFFEELGRHLKYNFLDGKWRIDVQITNDNKQVYKDKGYDIYSGYDRNYALVPITDFCDLDMPVPKEDTVAKNIHLMNAKEKEQYYKKHGKPRGWGSDLKAKKNPLSWEQAKRTSENMIITFEKYTKMEWEILTSNPEKKIEGQRLIDIVQNAYRKSDRGAFVKTMADVLKSHWLVIDCDEYDDIDACIFYRTPRKDENWRGYKIQGIGHDGDPKAKELVLNKLKSLLRKPGYWIECSGKLEINLSNNNLNVVGEEDLQKLFPKSKIDMLSDGQYKRTLGNDWIKETTFGNPLF